MHIQSEPESVAHWSVATGPGPLKLNRLAANVKSLRGKVAVGVLIAGVIVLLAFTLSGKRASTAAPITFRFGGFSTNAAQAVLAMFSITNSSPWTFNYRAGLPQAKTNGYWSQVQITEGGMTMIRPGESISFLVSVPETNGVWRVPVVFGERRMRTSCKACSTGPG